MGFNATCNKRNFVDRMNERMEIGMSKHVLTMQNMSMSKHTQPTQKNQCTKLIFLLDCVNCSYVQLLFFNESHIMWSTNALLKNCSCSHVPCVYILLLMHTKSFNWRISWSCWMVCIVKMCLDMPISILLFTRSTTCLLLHVAMKPIVGSFCLITRKWCEQTWACRNVSQIFFCWRRHCCF